MARPNKLTAEVADAICRSLREGNTREDAAELAGITGRTFFKWLAEGRLQKEGAKVQLLQAVKRAEAEAAAHCVKVVRKAMPKSWQAAAWWLERRRKNHYGKAATVEVKGDKKKPLRLEARTEHSLNDDLLPYIDVFREMLGDPASSASEGLSGSNPQQPVPPAEPNG